MSVWLMMKIVKKGQGGYLSNYASNAFKSLQLIVLYNEPNHKTCMLIGPKRQAVVSPLKHP